MDRAISPNEVKVVRWLLDHALGDVKAYRLHPVEELRVVGGCSCGCSSLYFSSKRGSLQRLADEVALYPDGQTAGLMLWGSDGEIVWLEVYDFEPESSHRVLMSQPFALGKIGDVEIWDVRTWSSRTLGQVRNVVGKNPHYAH